MLGDLHSLSQWISINKSARPVITIAFILSTKRLGLEMVNLGFRPRHMSSVDSFLPTGLGLPFGGNSARLGLHVPPFLSSTPFCQRYFLGCFRDVLPGHLSPLSASWPLNARATLILFSYCSSFPEDTLFSLGLKRPSAINIKNLPSEKSSFLRSL